jgi:UDP-N-acetylglucosamine 3-dehydrogenase
MTLRAGVIGIGVMGRHHSRVLAGLEGVDFVGVYDPAPNVPEVIEGKPVFSDLDEFLSLGPDYCVIAAPTIYHLELGTKLAENGIHALIEKPVASDSIAAGELVKLFNDAKLIGGVGHIERFNPALQSLRKRIEDGQLGEIFQVATRRQGPFPGRIADVGVVKDLGTHDIDLTSWVCQQEFISVNARTTHKSGRPHEDMVVAVGTLANGTITNHVVNWLSPIKERTTVVTGEFGTLVADTLTADLTFYANGTTSVAWDGVSSFRGVSEGDITRYALEKREPLKTEHEGFRDAVLSGDTSNIVTLAEGMKVVETAEKIVADGLSHRI